MQLTKFSQHNQVPVNINNNVGSKPQGNKHNG